MAATRLDKYLAQSGERSRSEAVRAVRMGQVRVNGVPVRDPSVKVKDGDTVTLAGETVGDDALQYYLLYKPSGVLTAARDSRAETVMDLLPEALRGIRIPRACSSSPMTARWRIPCLIPSATSGSATSPVWRANWMRRISPPLPMACP